MSSYGRLGTYVWVCVDVSVRTFVCVDVFVWTSPYGRLCVCQCLCMHGCVIFEICVFVCVHPSVTLNVFACTDVAMLQCY
uniref:Uncharacterized protein n=1 Tax=Denticeps clupeoides TaxID=299321 RepID=A0AAY4C7I2_9TELE